MAAHDDDNLMEEVDAHSLLETYNQYSIDILPQLVRELYSTITHQDFDLELANGILRLYRFYPTDFDGDSAASILMGALMQLPENDFTLCLCFLHPDNLQHARVKQVIHMHNLLEECKFDKFWSYLREHEDLLMVKLKVPAEYDYETEEDPQLISEEKTLTCRLNEFKDSIIQYICSIISSTYQTINKNAVINMMGGLDEVKFQVLITKQDWTLHDDDTIFIKNQENDIKSQDIVKNVQFESLVDLLAACLK
eukprot:gene3532-8312_t